MDKQRRVVSLTFFSALWTAAVKKSLAETLATAGGVSQELSARVGFSGIMKAGANMNKEQPHDGASQIRIHIQYTACFSFSLFKGLSSLYLTGLQLLDTRE